MIKRTNRPFPALSPIAQAAQSANNQADQPQERQSRSRKQRAPVPEGLADVALIDAQQCAAAGGMGLSQWYQMVAAGTAPAAAVRRPRYTRWRMADIREWLVDRAVITDADRLVGSILTERAKAASDKAGELRRAAKAGLAAKGQSCSR